MEASRVCRISGATVRREEDATILSERMGL
jgi:hypothetical protein